MTEQMRILTMRLKEAAPVFRKLNRKLLKEGGEILVVHPEQSGRVADMVFRVGRPIKATVTIQKGARNDCHRNTAKLWRAGKLDAICLGYGLSEEGLWREHYWGMKDDHIVETTIPRIAYFGATFRGEAGDIIVGYLEG
jgi:hypothetical protein